MHGVFLWNTTGSKIENVTASNNLYGIYLCYLSSNNILTGNNASNNDGRGIELARASNNNSLIGNTASNNGRWGIYLDSSINNVFFHNNFINNTEQVHLDNSFDNIWDNGCEGNYWSDYSGTDMYSGPYQNETGSDGIGDTPYVLNANNQDNYPLMKSYPWDPHDIGITTATTSKTVVGQEYSLHINVSIFNYGMFAENFNVTAYANTTIIDTLVNVTLTSGNSITITFTWNITTLAKGNYTLSATVDMVPGEVDTTDNTLVDGVITITIPGDVDGDFDVDIYDVVKMCTCYGSELGDPEYEANCDIDGDGDVDIYDIVIMCNHYGETYP